MSSVIHNKLVRDKIPDIIKVDKGKHPITKILSDDEYVPALLNKLGEEYEEFKADLSIEELADIQEVILTLANALNFSLEQLERVRAEKASYRGGFTNRVFLERVDED